MNSNIDFTALFSAAILEKLKNGNKKSKSTAAILEIFTSRGIPVTTAIEILTELVTTVQRSKQ